MRYLALAVFAVLAVLALWPALAALGKNLKKYLKMGMK